MRSIDLSTYYIVVLSRLYLGDDIDAMLNPESDPDCKLLRLKKEWMH